MHDAPALAGNLLLDRLFGARVELVPAIDPLLAVGDDAPVVERVVREEAAAGRPAYVIAVGGSSPVGTLGYVAGTLELVEQLQAIGATPSRLYFASGSRGTQAGLTLGKVLCGAPYALHGVAVSGGEPEKIVAPATPPTTRPCASVCPTASRMPTSSPTRASSATATASRRTRGWPPSRCSRAPRRCCSTPTYTAKGMAALLRHVRDGVLGPDETVVFLHTGGSPALFTEEFATAFAAWERR